VGFIQSIGVIFSKKRIFIAVGYFAYSVSLVLVVIYYEGDIDNRGIGIFDVFFNQ
jgi:hypothetical protein